MVDLEKYPEDRIPGLTSYIHSEHRPRESHEYIGHWQIEETSSELEKILGLVSYSRAELVKLISELNIDRKDIKNDKAQCISELNSELKQVTARLDLATNRNQGLEQQVDDYNRHFIDMHRANTKLIKYLDSFGDHQPDCAYLELAVSGRIITQDESDLCTCGWSNARKDQSVLKQIIPPIS